MRNAMGRTGIRLVLLAVLLASMAASIGASPTSAEENDGVISPAWSIIDEDGYWGDYFYEDSYGAPGGECWNHGSAVDITLTGPWLYASIYYYYQPVSVNWEI